MFYMNIANCLLLVLDASVVHQVDGGRCKACKLLGRFWGMSQPHYSPQMTYPFPLCWHLFSNHWGNSHFAITCCSYLLGWSGR